MSDSKKDSFHINRLTLIWLLPFLLYNTVIFASFWFLKPTWSLPSLYSACPGISDPFCIVTYYITGMRVRTRFRFRSHPVIFAPPDPGPVLFSTDPDPDLDPTCNNGFIKLFLSWTKYKSESTNSSINWWVIISNFIPTYLKYKNIFFFISISGRIRSRIRIRIRNFFSAEPDPDPWKKIPDPHPWKNQFKTKFLWSGDESRLYLCAAPY